MIREIELTNFEGHKHSVIGPFSDGFNLICGMSDSGKSAICRALRLVAYNEWNPRSLRVGTKRAEVKVTTERGWVKVTRGKGVNEWEVARSGADVLLFSKPGRNTIIPEAAEIIGLATVQLGSISTRPNVMDQLEGHFMLSEMDGEGVTGSARAQIVDEISGLAGMEELIRQVALDNHRNGREIRETEKTIEELEGQKHDEAMLEKEEETLSVVEGKLADARDAARIAEESTAARTRILSAQGILQENRDNLAAYPDFRVVLGALGDAEKKSNVAAGALSLLKNHTKASGALVADKRLHSRLGNPGKAVSLLDDARSLTARSGAALRQKSKCEQAAGELRRLTVRLQTIPDVAVLCRHLQQAHEKVGLVREIRKFVADFSRAEALAGNAKRRRDKAEADWKETKEALDAAMKAVELCPICLEPVHPGCKAHTPKKVAKKARTRTGS